MIRIQCFLKYEIMGHFMVCSSLKYSDIFSCIIDKDYLEYNVALPSFDGITIIPSHKDKWSQD